MAKKKQNFIEIGFSEPLDPRGCYIRMIADFQSAEELAEKVKANPHEVFRMMEFTFFAGFSAAMNTAVELGKMSETRSDQVIGVIQKQLDEFFKVER